jgi:hypothetical protein
MPVPYPPEFRARAIELALPLPKTPSTPTGGSAILGATPHPTASWVA